MATALRPEFQEAFEALAAQHGDLLLAEQLLSFLIGAPAGAPPAASTRSRVPPFDAPASVTIQAQLRVLVKRHGAELTSAEARQLLLSYALAGARRQMVKRAGKDGCPECAARAVATEQVDAAIRRVRTTRPQGNPPSDTEGDARR
jgi:hypothetical protein